MTLARAVEHLDEGRLVAGDTIGYVRTGGGNEVDFGPVPIPGNAGAELSVPLESKWVDDGWRGEAKALDGKYGSVNVVPLSGWAVGCFRCLVDN